MSKRFIPKLELDRALAGSILKQITILLVSLLLLWGISFLLLSGAEHDLSAYCDNKHVPNWLLPFYLLIDANAFNQLYTDKTFAAGHTYVIVVGCLTYILGIVLFSGMIISLLSNYVAVRKEKYLKGLTYYLKSGHYVIMGYDNMVPSIICHIVEKKPDASILLLTSEDAISVREELRKSVAEQYVKQVLVNFGHRVSKDYYDKIHLESAERIYVVGNRNKPQHDAVNVECVESICEYLSDKQHSVKRIVCVFENLDTYVSFCSTDIFAHLTQSIGITLIPYNYYVGWAKQVFVNRKYKSEASNDWINYPAVCGTGIRPEDEEFVHLVFVGTSTFAISFAREAAHLMHFPNFKEGKHRTRITFIDSNADVEMQEVMTRYRHLFEVQSYYYGDYTEKGSKCSKLVVDRKNNNLDKTDFLDVEFEFIKGDIFSKSVQDLLCQWHLDKQQYLSLFFAMSRQDKNFAIAMNLPDELYEQPSHNDWTTPIFIRQDNADNFVTLLRQRSENALTGDKVFYRWVEKGEMKEQKRPGRYSNIYPFGMNDTAFYVDDLSLRQAKLINYLYSTANYDQYKFPSLVVLNGMTRDAIWREANEEWQGLTVAKKWSNIYAASSIQYKLMSLRAMRGLRIDDESQDLHPLTDKEIDAMSPVEHNRWNVEELLMGFRKPLPKEDKYANEQFASKLDNNKKHFIHHDIRPYDDLNDVKKLDAEYMRYMPWVIEMTR